jgi:hypothetical protein
MGVVTHPCFGIHSTAATGDVEDLEEYYDDEEEEYEEETAAGHEAQDFDGMFPAPPRPTVVEDRRLRSADCT